MLTTVQDSLIRSASLRGYTQLVSQMGRDPNRYLREVGLTARLIDDPDAMIPGDAVRELLELTAKATGAEDFALQLAARRELADLGPISLVLKEEPTPREALQTLCRYLALLNACLITRVEDHGATVIVREDLLIHRPMPMRQSMELAVGVMHGILRELVGPGWRPLRVCFTHRAPKTDAAHRSYFAAPVSFNQDFNGIVCAARDLSAPRQAVSQGPARFVREHLDRALRHQGVGRVEVCRQLMLALLPGGRCTAEQLAQHLRIDRRTLHRHLAAEGMHFSALLNQVRAQVVIRHLQDSDLSLTEISGLLGFAAPTGLAHWFRAQFGCSVTAWRRRHAST